MLLIIEHITHTVKMADVSPCPTCSEKRCARPNCVQKEDAAPGVHWQVYCGPDGIDYLRGYASTMEAAFADAMQQANDALSIYEGPTT